MRIFITFGDEKFQKSRDFAAKMAKIFGGFDRVITYTPADIDRSFYDAHKDIFAIKRGFGLWLWKPYFVYKALTEVCQDGDCLFYQDGGAFLIRNIKYVEKAMGSDDFWVSCVPLCEWQFTKKDAFELLDCHGDNYEKTPQIQGGFLYIRKNEKTVEIIKEWLTLCSDIRLLHPENIELNNENPKGFHGHREDQSILSLLCKKKGITPHQDPSQYSRFPEKYWRKGFEKMRNIPRGEYPPLLILHRTAKLRVSDILRQVILLFIPRFIGLRLITYSKD